MQGGVQHDDCETEHVARVSVREDVRVELTVALREAFHHSVDLLRFAGETKAPEELSVTR